MSSAPESPSVWGNAATPPVVAVVGATATGKSDLAVSLATSIGAEVVNADSMQLYEGMDIGTAKLTLEQRRGIPHHLLDVWPVTRPASVVAYRDLARGQVDALLGRGCAVVVVGGSGLYVRALLDDLDFPATDAAVRASLEAELEDVGPAVLHDRLTALDPPAASSIDAANGRRIVRALEVVELEGSYSAKLPEPRQHYPFVVQLGLTRPRPDLASRIEARIDAMFAAGLVDEVRHLAEQHGLRKGKTASQALGYAQVLGFLNGDTDLDAARRQTVTSTRRFARRQESWFRRDSRIRWLAADSPRLADDARAAVQGARAGVS